MNQTMMNSLNEDDYHQEDDFVSTPSKDSGGNRITHDSISFSSQAVEILVFEEPAECARSQNGCDWSKLGVGVVDSDGINHWCCSEDELYTGVCAKETDTFGRLIIDKTTFNGEYRFVPIPVLGPFESKEKLMEIDVTEGNGKYTIVIANCDDYGRNVKMEGPYVWKSNHGFLPGERFEEWNFMIAILVIYICLFLWYGMSMKKYSDSSIELQMWIIFTVGVGLAEVFFRVGDYWVWNEDGTRLWFSHYSGMMLGVCKRALSRCLIIMVSLGWGVVRDTLGDHKRIIIIVGIAYTIASIVFEISDVIRNEELKQAKKDPATRLVDFIKFMIFVVELIDVFIYFWVFDALSNTIKYLENMSQHMKLRRYLKLRFILSFSVLFSVVWVIFGIVDSLVETAIFDYEQKWVVQGAWEVNYLAILISVAILWRPHPDSKNYAYVMELSSEDNDIEMETSIEMIEDNITSSEENGLADENEFQIEDSTNE
eukprot:CAMPEP_0197825104 /NCGR_PEP_ID=MMETSP1437-20131217/2240_1 /TAXON_ID=49252 ORGANISM="Eucampia antarctica, Strain CCMP1452" /NCGR_SAMPLE_ID=MMETSP1437 /ASSEMBLY_ACC=CAM_ASM_001096 /LENGTH=483 /DNA_ID=CAMNT_0043424969 /DNA_START=269 /DNA_END=1720 /DNA_ORIENTATION=+